MEAGYADIILESERSLKYVRTLVSYMEQLYICDYLKYIQIRIIVNDVYNQNYTCFY